MAHYPSFAPILHCLIRERERDNVRYEVASSGNDVGCGGVGNEIGGVGEQMNRH